MRETSVEAAHFDRLYAARPDPWRYETSDYERAKYAATVAALPRPRYRAGLDVGCSVGVLTGLLAERCDALVAIDAVQAAVERAQMRAAGRPGLTFARMTIPTEWPDGRFDLVVISEVIDYLGDGDLGALVGRLEASLEPGGDLLLVHWVGKKGPVPRPGEATDELAARAASMLAPLHATRNRDYRLDLFRRR